MIQPLYYDYIASKAYCESIGLQWLGDDFVRSADAEAHEYLFTQEQVDVAMRHHLWQVLWLFTPSNYNWFSRVLLVFYFLTGWKPKIKK